MPPEGLRFSCATVSLPTVPVDQAPDVVRRYGLTGIEWKVGEHPAAMRSTAAPFLTKNLCTLDLSPGSAVAAAERCAEAGIALVGLAPYIDVGDEPKLNVVLEMARACGARMIRLQAARLAPGDTYATQFQRTRVFLENAVGRSRRYGVKLALEIHHGTVCPSASLATTMTAGFAPEDLGVIFDPGNMVIEGYEDHRIGLELLGDRLTHVHLKNANAQPPEHRPGPWRTNWSALDDGLLDVAGFLELLSHHDYKGWISLEDLSTVRDPVETLAYNSGFLRRLGVLDPR